jgi:hypothetical protein
MQKRESLFDHQKEKLVVGQKTQILKYEKEKQRKERKEKKNPDRQLFVVGSSSSGSKRNILAGKAFGHPMSMPCTKVEHKFLVSSNFRKNFLTLFCSLIVN